MISFNSPSLTAKVVNFRGEFAGHDQLVRYGQFYFGERLTDASSRPNSYHLTRLRRNGLIERQAHGNTYSLTPDGLRVALFYTKVHNRFLRQALATIDRHVNGFIDQAVQNAA